MPAPLHWAYGACWMNRSKLRRQITWEAARLMYSRQESEYYRAKMKAARLIGQGWVKPADLPSNAEIRDEIQSLARLYEGESRVDNLREMRLAALAMMQRLAPFRPRLIGSTLTGHVRQGSDIDLHVFSDTTEAVTHVLDGNGLSYTVEKKQVRKQGEERIFTHIHFTDGFPFELTIYAADKAHYVSKSSITGKAIERASIAELEQFLAREYPDLDVNDSDCRPGGSNRPVSALRIAALAAGECEAAAQIPSGGRRALSQPASLRPGAKRGGVR